MDYDMLNDMEKKTLFNSFVDEVHLYPQELENGQFLKKIKFKFPVFYNGEDVREICWDKDSSVETVCLLSKPHEVKHHVNVTLEIDELDVTAAESKALH